MYADAKGSYTGLRGKRFVQNVMTRRFEMPAEQDDFWLIRPLRCDFLKDEKCTHKEEFSGSSFRRYGSCGISSCPFERWM